MSTSGSTNFTLTRNELIQEALERVGAVAEGQNPTAGQQASAAKSLNIIIKKWQNEHKFEHKKVMRFKVLTASSEVTGSDGEVYTCILNHTSAAANQPITGANYRMYWKQEGSTGGVWATATAYAGVQEFTLDTDIIDVAEVYFRDETPTDHPIDIIGYNDYLKISDKYSDTTIPTKCVLKKEVDSIRVFLYPRPSDTDYTFIYYGTMPIEDFDGATNNPDLPVEYFDALCEELSDVIAQKTGDYEASNFMRDRAKDSKKNIRDTDHQPTDDDFIVPCF